MAKSKSPRAAKSMRAELTLDNGDAAWGQAALRVAKELGKSPNQMLTEALRDWLWQASGLKRLFEQVRETGEQMTRAFQVEGMLVSLAKSGGVSLGAQSDYLKRAEQEREQYTEHRKKLIRLVRDVRRVAGETQLPGAVEAAAKLVVPE